MEVLNLQLSQKQLFYVAIVDSYKAFEESKRIKSANIKINVGEKIDYKELGYTKTSELCEHTKLAIEKLYRK